jgi:hypothetical protein
MSAHPSRANRPRILTRHYHPVVAKYNPSLETPHNQILQRLHYRVAVRDVLSIVE